MGMPGTIIKNKINVIKFVRRYMPISFSWNDIGLLKSHNIAARAYFAEQAQYPIIIYVTITKYP